MKAAQGVAMNGERYPEENDNGYHRSSHGLIYLRLGFLAHDDQEVAFSALIHRHLTQYATTSSCRRSLPSLSQIDLDEATNDFMATYEKVIWPHRSADKSNPAPWLNDPMNGKEGEGQDDESEGVLQWDVHGRVMGSVEYRNAWRVRHRVEPTEREYRMSSPLFKTLREFVGFLKGEEAPQTGLTERELLACVLAGFRYKGNGWSMKGVMDEDVKRANGEPVQEPLPSYSTTVKATQRRQSTPPSA